MSILPSGSTLGGGGQQAQQGGFFGSLFKGERGAATMGIIGTVLEGIAKRNAERRQSKELGKLGDELSGGYSGGGGNGGDSGGGSAPQAFQTAAPTQGYGTEMLAIPQVSAGVTPSMQGIIQNI